MRKMNKKTIMTGISGLVLLFALEASAQRPLPPPGTGGPEWHPGDPHEIPPGLSPMLIKALGLTDDQQEKINKLTSKAGLEGARIMARAKLKKAEIVYLWSDGSPERGRIMAKQKEISDLMAKGMELKNRLILDIWDVLTAGQKEKALPFILKRMDSRGERPMPRRDRFAEKPPGRQKIK